MNKQSDIDLGHAYDLSCKLRLVMHGHDGKVCAAAMAIALGSVLTAVRPNERDLVLETIEDHARTMCVYFENQTRAHA